MNRFSILKLHRALSLWAAVAVIIWGCSGLLHPLMTWTSPRPVVFTPPPLENFIAPGLHDLKRALGDRRFTNLRVLPGMVNVDGTIIDLKGNALPSADAERAIMLARHYSGERAEITQAAPITKFDNKYPYINRYLPAWRVQFDDGKAVYIETSTDRLGSITSRLKIILQTVFENMHTFKFLDGFETLRLILIFALVASVPAMAIMGLFLHGAIRRRTQGPRRYHRVLTLIAALPLLGFGLSGLFHLGANSTLIYDAPPAVQMISTSDLRFMPAGKVEDLRLVDGWWRAQTKADVSYRDAKTGSTIKGDELFARRLAAEWGALDIKTVTLVPAFTSEYGFANKRLPVWRIEPANGPILFIEPRTATLAARITPMAKTETWTFANIHKWQFFTNRPLRDGLMIVTILLGVAGAVAGLRLLARKKTGFKGGAGV